MSRNEPRVDFHEATKLATEVRAGRIQFTDASHRLYQYWETRITPRQAEHKLRRRIDAMNTRQQ